MRAELRTERLRLRRWRPEDQEPFRRLNADPAVMEHFTGPMPAESSDALYRHLVEHFAEHGFGLWAVDIPGVVDFAGFIGLHVISTPLPVPAITEIGWRLTPEVWGRGYATEGARAALTFGFTDVGLEEIIAYTAATNRRSRRVMEKLGLRHHLNDDFDDPRIPVGHPARHQVVYRMRAEDFSPPATGA